MLSKPDDFDGVAYMQQLEVRDNTNYAKALQELCPGAQWAVSGNDYESLLWAEWNTHAKPSKEELDAKVEELVLRWENTQYQRDRSKEYPSIGDQLDALWKGGAHAEEMLQLIMDTKSKFPKPQVE